MKVGVGAYSALLILAGAVAMVLPAGSHAQSSGAERQLARAHNTFALDLYARLQSQTGNLFLSPYSISAALSMTYAGAREETAREMAATLHLPSDATNLHLSEAALQRQLEGGKQNSYELIIANRLWGQQGYGFLKSFLDLIDKNYGAALQELDFRNSSEPARQVVNEWVAEKTREKIRNLLPPGSVTNRTRLILTNAVYFKGLWAFAFDPKATRPAPFLGTSGKREIPMMSQTTHLAYAETGEVQVLELPYRGADLAMVVFLPRKPDGLEAFERGATLSKIETLAGALSNTQVAVLLPKFRLTSVFKLKPELAALGMRRAFVCDADDPNLADFSGMTGKKNLCVSEAFHQAFVDVNEEGTEAAAATGIVMAEPTSVRRPAVFRADHPFLFLIRDRRSGSILFLGRFAAPEAS